MTNEEAIRVFGRMLNEFCNEDTWMQECKDAVDMAIEALKEQPESCEYAVSAIAVEEMLKDLLPERGMWEIEGDEVKTAICETVRDALEGLWKLPFVRPEVIACGSGELNDETGMEWVSNAGMLRADEIHGSVLETVPIFGEEDPEPKPGGK